MSVRANTEVEWTQKADAFLVAGPVSLLFFFPLLTPMPIDSCLGREDKKVKGDEWVHCCVVTGWLSLFASVSHLLYVSLSSCLFALLLPGIPGFFLFDVATVFPPSWKYVSSLASERLHCVYVDLVVCWNPQKSRRALVLFIRIDPCVFMDKLRE